MDHLPKRQRMSEDGSGLSSLSPDYHLYTRATPFPNEGGEVAFVEFLPGLTALKGLDRGVLVIGAGGLGCEVLKDLALSGVRNITVVDMDTIDVTNLNRQFLFRKKDVGRPKATVAAEAVMSRVKGVTITSHETPIQKFPREWFQQFAVVVGALDNLEARRWMNSMLCSLVPVDAATGEPTANCIPYIDGGTEGFKGKVKVMLPKFTACFECHIEAFPPPVTFPMCTIAEKPRKPEHCVAYVMEVEWEKAWGAKPLDKDSPEDMHWVNDRASERADKYGIKGVNYTFTLGVAKSIIPAIAATNAMISAGCVQETLKLLTGMSQSIANETFFNGEVGQNISTDVLARKEQGKCLHCSHTPTFTIALPASSTLGDLVERLNGPAFQLKNVTIGPKGWVPWTREESNLERKLVDLGLQSGGALAMVVKDFNTSDGTLIVTLT